MNKKILALMPLFLASALPALGGGNHAGGHGHDDQHWMSPAAEQQRANPVTDDNNSIARGAKLFQQHCANCHGRTAEGDGPAGMSLNPRPTNLQVMSGRHTDGDFAWKIKNGRGAMPAWAETLQDQDIWHLVNYIQSLQIQPKQEHRDHEHHGHKH